MAKIASFRNVKGEGNFAENLLTPVNLLGVVVPSGLKPTGVKDSHYKLVRPNGIQYFLVANREWRGVLSRFTWEEVRVIGLLNTETKTIIPQKVFPKGPKGEKESVIDLAIWKGRETIKKAIANINDMVAMPAAVLAVLNG